MIVRGILYLIVNFSQPHIWSENNGTMISGNAKSKTHLVIVTVQLPATKIFVWGTVCGAIGRDIPVSSVLMFLSSVQNQNKDQWQKKPLPFLIICLEFWGNCVFLDLKWWCMIFNNKSKNFLEMSFGNSNWRFLCVLTFFQ